MNKFTGSHKEFFIGIHKKSDKIVDAAMLAYFLNGLFLSFFYDTWLIGLGVGSLCLLAYFGSRFILPKSKLYHYVAATVFAVFMAQFIYQMHGMFEMHFWAYVAATLLITYQNWKLFIPLTIVIVLHHGGFAWLQYSGMEEIYFTQLEYMDLQTFIFHAFLAVVIVSICAYWSYDLAAQTIESGLNRTKLQLQLKNMELNIGFAEEISKGNLFTDYTKEDSHDELGTALLNMQQHLIQAAEREKQEKFISNGIARLSDVLRNNLTNVEQLSEGVVREVVNYLNLNQAGLYLTETLEGREVMQLKACYAYNRKKFVEQLIEIGEGLVGQAYLEREPIYMTDIPQGYTRITSGLGEATARSILIVPLINNEKVVGVLEVAALQLLQPNHIEFLKKASESIASTILSARINFKTNRLLEQAQEQTEAMRAQEEEVRQNMEELEATQEELIRQAKEYQESMQAKQDEILALKKLLTEKETMQA